MRSRYRWFVVGVFFVFMLLHQADKLLIGPLTTSIMETFHLTRTQMGAISTGALIVGAICYPLWGYLYDRYARAKLLALASFIWGSTTWLSAIAPTYPTFLATRATTGIDDSSYPGLYSLISDYFGPQQRGRVIGLLQVAMPVGYLLGMMLALTLRDTLGWRGVFYLTGSIGVLLSLVIYFFVREAPRGQSEPELSDLGAELTHYRFEWSIARGLFAKPTLRLLFIQGFLGVFPWNVITYWTFNYLETERGYDEGRIMVTMVAAVLAMALGNPIAGLAGDLAFKRTPRGRVMVATTGVLLGAVLLALALNVPVEQTTLFGVLLTLTAFFMPFAASNVVATVYDVTLPEVRSTALSVQYFIESAGAALAPLLAGIIADQTSLKTAFLVICISAWLICALFFSLVAFRVPGDVAILRAQLRERAAREKHALA